MDISGTRRSLLAAVGSVVGLSGCMGFQIEDGSETGGDPTTTDTPADTPTDTSADATTTSEESTSDLDLREANVLEVVTEPRDGRTVTFDVTLLHDDEGEDGYADWWQVETLDGTKLGRRTLAHAHGTQPFTRSADVEVPADVTCVVVRGHDQTHGYGGQTILVDLESGATETDEQGPEPRTFGEEDCP